MSRKKIDHLAGCSKLQLNFSLDALDEEKAKKMVGTNTYSVKHIKEMIAYASDKMKVIVAPIMVPGWNEEEMEKIILFLKSIPQQPRLGIQNFLRYKTGRNPAKQLPWEDFYEKLAEWEKKHGMKLRWTKEDFNVGKTKELPKPFREGEIITATIKCPDRFSNGVIAVADDRNISVPNCSFRRGKKIEVMIVRDKHNIFVGKER